MVFRLPCPGAAVAATLLAASSALAAGDGGIVIRAKEGGKNPAFCMPQWSIANETGQDIGALLIELEWRNRAGQVLQPVGAFGTLVERFKAGVQKDMSLSGFPGACAELQLVVRTYACRDTNAVRVPCPGPVRAQAPGQVKVDLAAAVEGRMKGAVEPR